MKMKFAVLLLVIVVNALRAFGEEKIYHVATAGMAPTIPPDSHVRVILDDECRHHIKRFDLVVFNLDFEAYGKTIQIKRVIGLPGERVEIRDKSIFIDGVKLALPASIDVGNLIYKNSDWQARTTYAQLMPEDGIFVLGDNAGDSLDSRMLGSIKLTDVIGKCLGKMRELKKPDQAPPQTSANLTPAAGAPVAPPSGTAGQ